MEKVLQRRVFELSFFEFVKWAAVLLEPNTNWRWGFFHEYLCSRLEEETHRITAGIPKERDIIINIPFRASKSFICTICYPIWSWIINPHISFKNVSYGVDLSTELSEKVMSIITDPDFQELYPWEFDEFKRSKTSFKLKNGAERESGSVRTILGKGGTVVIWDDPNNSELLSEVEIRKTIRGWRGTLSTRLNDPAIGLFIIIQQRLHARDISGYLLDSEGLEVWEHICLPARDSDKVNPPELREFYEDGLLWKEFLDEKALKKHKLRLGTQGFNNQLLMNPTDVQGNIIQRKWIKSLPEDQFNDNLFVSTNSLTGQKTYKEYTWDLWVDPAFTDDKTNNDPTGVMVATCIDNIMYVRKCYEYWKRLPKNLEKLQDIMNKHGVHESMMYVEPKATGTPIVDSLRSQTTLNVVEIPPPKTSKEVRLTAVSPMVESGRLVIIEDYSNDLLIDEICDFPNAPHDEFVDLVGYAMTHYLQGSNDEMNYLF